jgi:hypothetical protein
MRDIKVEIVAKQYATLPNCRITMHKILFPLILIIVFFTPSVTLGCGPGELGPSINITINFLESRFAGGPSSLKIDDDCDIAYRFHTKSDKGEKDVTLSANAKVSANAKDLNAEIIQKQSEGRRRIYLECSHNDKCITVNGFNKYGDIFNREYNNEKFSSSEKAFPILITSEVPEETSIIDAFVHLIKLCQE